MMESKDHTCLRLSLVFVWLATAVASVWERQGQSAALLASVGINSPVAAGWLIWGGAGLDVALGRVLWFKPVRRTYFAALGIMLLMTLAATLLAPSLWLHPLGPLTKNVPIAVVLLVLAKARS